MSGKNRSLPNRLVGFSIVGVVLCALALEGPAQSLAQEFKVETRTPTQFRVKLSDLPPPFATPSAGQAPRIAEVPTDPVVKLPPGCTMTVYAGEVTDGPSLHEPRWPALAPDDSVRVAESEKSR